jgi:hypothetical protein
MTIHIDLRQRINSNKHESNESENFAQTNIK